MAFTIECQNPEYKATNGLTSRANGEYIPSALVFTDSLPYGTPLDSFGIRAHNKRDPRYVIDVRIEAQEYGLLLRALQTQSNLGNASFTIPEDFYRLTGFRIIIPLNDVEYPCIIHPVQGTNAVAPPKYKPWQSRGFYW